MSHTLQRRPARAQRCLQDAYKICRKSLNYYDQANQLPACKQADASLGTVFSQVLQDVLRRVDQTFRAFFRRGYGFPRFRSRNRYASFTYPQAGFSLEGRYLKLSKIGNLKIKLHRPVEGQIKTLTLKQENGIWYACFACVVERKPLPANDKAVGIDMGLESFPVTSDGEVFANPRWYRKTALRLRLLPFVRRATRR